MYYSGFKQTIAQLTGRWTSPEGWTLAWEPSGLTAELRLDLMISGPGRDGVHEVTDINLIPPNVLAAVVKIRDALDEWKAGSYGFSVPIELRPAVQRAPVTDAGEPLPEPSAAVSLIGDGEPF